MGSVTDLAQFATEDFQAKAWVNNACAQLPDGEVMERYLAELEMRLHLTAEDVESALKDNSTRALQRIPAAVQEVERVKGDVLALKADVHRTLDQLQEAQVEAAESVSLLVEVDRVKVRMEAACKTLTEATELSQLFLRVEDIFASGNLLKISETLATMRRSLHLVGDVPEFKGGMRRLEALEDRFQALVEGSLAAAFVARAGEEVRQLTGMLLAINRAGTVEQLYTSARLTPLQGAWDGFAPDPVSGGFAAWLPTWYEEVVSSTEAESHWVATTLPDQHPALVLNLLASLFAKIDKPFRIRLSGAIQGLGEGATPLGVLIHLQHAAQRFVRGLQRALPVVAPEQLVDLATAVFAPCEAQVVRYGELEGRQLAAEMGGSSLPNAASDDMEAVVAGLNTSVAHAIAAVQAGLDRCMSFTGGTGMPRFLAAADENLSEHVSQLSATLHDIRVRVMSDAQQSSIQGEEGAAAAAADGSGDGGEGELPQVSEERSALLPLLNVAGGLVNRLGLLDAALRNAVLELGPAWEAAVGEASDPLDVLSLRLRAGQGTLLQRLQAFVAGADDARYVALATATSRAFAFQEAASTLVYDALMIKVKEQMAGVGQMAVWAAAEPDNEYNLPSFSAYPLPYVTRAGEYLIMLPQLLEGALPGEEAAEDSHVDAEWLDKVAAGAAEMYAAGLAQVGHLSPHGAAQLAADLEYFCNVLAVLSVAPPPALVTWQAAAGFPAASFREAAAEGAAHGGLDQRTLELVARARRLPLQ